MWLFTPFGFFSVVRKSAEMVSVRSGTRGDLLRLRRTYLPELSDPTYLKGTDHPWRGQCGPNDIGRALGRIVEDIDYTNFQDEADLCSGPARARRYLKVWKAMYGMEEDLPEPEPERAAWPVAGHKATYGGVVIDPRGRLLLYEAPGSDGHTVWTFPIGPRSVGEAPHEAAARVVLEATGVPARWLLHLPKGFKAGASVCRFALMLAPVARAEVDPTASSLSMRQETQPGPRPSVAWLTPDQARSRIHLNTKVAERLRDLDILETACQYLPPDLDRHPIHAGADLRRRPLPARRVAFPMARTFYPEQMAGLIRGSMPGRTSEVVSAPQACWCAVFERGMLHVHDAHSGAQYFRLHFEWLAELGDARWRIGRAELNMHPGQLGLPPDLATEALHGLLDEMTALSGEGLGYSPGL